MNNFDFNPYGVQSIIISFECENMVESEEISVPEPDYTAEKMGDGQRMEEGYAICSNCNKDFNIDIYSDGYGAINNLSEDIQVYIEEDNNENDFYEEYEEELFWEINSTEHLKIYKNHIKSIKEILLNYDFTEEIEFSLLVMLHSHIIASIELFLSSTFIHTVTSSEEFIKKLIETDPELGKQTLTLKEIYKEQSKLKITVASYLKKIIFHNLKKVKPMYKSVLNIDFGDINWLFKAVEKRHDCTHRAGYDKNGEKISISPESINSLIKRCEKLTEQISNRLLAKLKNAKITV